MGGGFSLRIFFSIFRLPFASLDRDENVVLSRRAAPHGDAEEFGRTPHELGGSAQLGRVFRNVLAADLWRGAAKRAERRGGTGCGAGNGDYGGQEHHEI